MSDSRVKIAMVDQIPEGEGRVFEAAGKTLAVFNAGGRFYAIDNSCTHRGGPLGEGELDGTIVTCPWHGWRWDVTTGANVNNPAVQMACFPVAVDDGQVLVDLTPRT